MVLLGVVTFRAEQLGRFFKKHNVYKAYFLSSKGVKKGSKVTLSGMDIGEVKRVDVEGDRLLVTMAIDKKTPIREGSAATIVPDFLFGKSYVDITMVPLTRPVLPPGSVIKGVDIPGFSDMVVRFDTAMASLERLVSEDFVQNLTNTLKKTNNILGKMEEGKGTMGRLLTDETLFNDLKETMSNANSIVGRLSRGEGTMGKLMTDETLFVDLKEAMGNANVLLGRVSRGEGTLGKLVTGEDLYEDIKKMTANLTETVNGFRTFLPHGAFTSVLYSSF
jgi:phospholipid/cholesterol/gamma-HCH transport system substrate-binding protein